MAQLTPKDILEISEPIEAIYQRTVDDLLINIARHFNITGWERTRYWEIKKLSEMGALTKESAAIIAKNTKMAPEEIEAAFLQVSEKACLDIDPQLEDAAAKGILQDPGTSATTSPLMRQMVQGYVDQAVDTLNMVNSTMLESTIRAYQQAIQTAVNEAMVQEAKEILEASALEVATGQETKVRAIRKAMDQMARAGIPGFYDSRGRAWSPDGYVAMVIRTTSHNAAIKAVQNRQMEYGGGDIFQVSSHPGARPLCYPYQGKFFSWSAGPGEFTDGAGKAHHYDNISDSSYGEPAGLFGINCGHHPIPMIPGYSYPQDRIEESPEENKKEYEESQKQRQYERQVREAKRELEVAKATGDEEATKAAKQKVAQEQAKIRAYTKETGRVRRYDREQIGSTAGTDYGPREQRKDRAEEPLAGGPKWTTGKRRSKAQAAAPAYSENMQRMVDGLKSAGVEYRQVYDRVGDLNDTEIIDLLGGGDRTSGSCVSVGLAYVGQKAGLEVRDFRGGESCDWFASNFGQLLEIDLGLPDMKLIKATARSQITAGKKLLKSVEEGEQYFFTAGQHATIVRKINGKLQYLELQHPTDNGWRDFNGNPGYDLANRFGARNRGTDETSVMFNVKDAQGSTELKDLLGYINTAENEQKKGKDGFIR